MNARIAHIRIAHIRIAPWWASLIANDDTARCDLLETLNLDQKCIFICTKFRTMIHDRGCNFDRNMKHWVVGPAMHGMHWFSRTLPSCEESPAATTLMQIEITARGSNGWKIEEYTSSKKCPNFRE